MKNCILYIIAILFTATANAQHWQDTGSKEPAEPVVSLLSNSDEQVVVQFLLNGFYLNEVTTSRGLQNTISVPKMFPILEAGTPDLPQYPIPVIIDDHAEMRLRVKDSQHIDFHNIEIAPSKGNLSRQVNPETIPYPYGTPYETDAFYPDEAACLAAPYILRDFRGQNIMICPFAYNPVTKVLRVYTQLTISMEKIGNDGENPKTARKSSHIQADPEWRHAYSRRFINFGLGKYDFLDDRGSMLVISPERYLEAMRPLVDWKNQSGRPTSLVSLEEIGGNDKNLIKAYIQDMYRTEGLTFVLFVGDYADITPHSLGNNGSSDAWFGQLEGNDNYIEVFVGRFSVESIADVTNQVNKVIFYERDLRTGTTWVDHGIGIGATDGGGTGHNGGELDWEHLDNIRDTLLHYTYTDITRRYKGVNNPSANDLNSDFNTGASIVNYCNHGSETAWLVCNYNNANVNALTNDYRWPAIISTACLNGKFNHTQPCFAETWMRATNNSTGAPTGAIGGMFSWPTQPWAPPMTGQDEMNAILAEWRSTDTYRHTMGGTFLNGNMKILDAHPIDAGITHNTWILFGDPSLMLRTDNPTSMNVHYSPDVFMQGVNSLLVTAETSFGNATLSRNGEVIASADIQNGSTTLHFDPINGMGTLRLTVIGFNKETYVNDIDIASLDGAYVMLDQVSIDDTDGQLDYGQSANLDITVKNVGAVNAGNTTVTLISNSEHVTVVNGSTSVNALGVGEQHTINGVFEVSVSNDVPDGTRAMMQLQCTDGNDTWNSDFYLSLCAPVIEMTDAYTIGDVQPGQQGAIRVVVTNSGNSPTQPGRIELFCASEAIQFNSDFVSLPVVAPQESLEIDIPFNASGNAVIGTAYEIDLYATAGLYHASSKLFVSIGIIKEDYETGDFTKFNWMFSGGDWTIVTDEVHTGNYAARSAHIANNRSSDMIIALNVEENGDISFWVRTASEPYCDKLRFYIDNDEVGNWSGIAENWEKASFPITSGTHLLRWVYSKDASNSQGEDCAWIDDIQFPPASVESNMPVVQGFEAIVNGNLVRLHWQALEGFDYVIRRNGQQIAQQSHNEYEETLSDGIYSYCVIATDGQGHYSEPNCLTVAVGVLQLDDNSETFAIYPNPVTSTLHILNNAEHFSYAMFNAMGQQMLSGTTSGQQQIDVSGMAKGIYYLKISDGERVSVKKIVVR